MSAVLAIVQHSYAWLGLVPVAVLTVAIIVNVSSFQTKDLNRRSGHAANLLFIALIIETAAWTVRAFGGGTETGAFWAVIVAAFLHVASAVLALWAFWEHRKIGRWPYGRRRATWGFWLNVFALIVLSGWFYLFANPKLYQRIFE